MLSNARSLGYVFNPLSLFWCHDPDGSLRCVIAEVHNTYGGKHCYLITPDDAGRAETEKRFYVSPFYPVDGFYRMSVAEPGGPAGRHDHAAPARRTSVHRLDARCPPAGRATGCTHGGAGEPARHLAGEEPRSCATESPCISRVCPFNPDRTTTRRSPCPRPLPPSVSHPSSKTSPASHCLSGCAPGTAARPARPAARSWSSDHAARCGGWSGARGSWGWPARTSPATSTSRVIWPTASAASGPPRAPGRRPAYGSGVADRLRAFVAAVRLGAIGPRPEGAGVGGSALGRPAHAGPRPGGDLAPLRPVQRLLSPAARRHDGLLERLLRAGRPAPRRGAARQTRPHLPQARSAARACDCSTSAAAGDR